ncbi:Bor family protein [bacterium]|nr:Bor family protein [bacterium]MBU1983007.1 Bor family protein [bacterium]
MKRIIGAILILAFCMMLVGCYTHIHQVGNGAQTGVKMEKKQWYILWGLVPLNEVDSQQMAAGATDYTIRTQQSFVDVVIGLVTGMVTIYPRTVAVTK